jgi:predicted ATPase/signal transduction histidine kinase
MLHLDDYDIAATIYESTRSRVLRGTRRADGRPVVVKVSARGRDADDLSRMRSELEIGQRLAGPGFLEYLALEPHPDGLAVVMEDFGGSDLSSRIPEGGLPIARFFDLAIAIADRLARIHKEGILHLDVKPANILVDADGTSPRICDFDLSTRLDVAAGSIEALRLDGTLLYISPEQTGRLDRPIDHRSDLYSFGVTLYEMLTGSPPFSGDAIELVHAHVALRPPPPGERRPDAPPAVVDIVQRLLAKSPGDRYATARGAREDLARAAELFARTGDAPRFPLGDRDIASRLVFPDRFYGREAEAQSLAEAFEAAAAGSREIVLVRGFSGIGKSTLVERLRGPVLERGGSFCRGKFDQLDRAVPYSAVWGALRGLVRDVLSEKEASLAAFRARVLSAAGPNGALLTAALPELSAILGEQPAPPEVGPAESRERFRWLSLAFIAALAPPDRPLVMFLDDLQWADDASLELLADIAAEPRCRHLLIVGAYRDNEVDAAHPLTLAIAAMEAGCPVRRIALEALDRGEALALITDVLHCDAALVEDLAALVYDKTQGNPFFMREFLRAAHAEGLVRFDDEALRWRWDVPGLTKRGFADNVIDLMVGEMRRLTPEAQRALGVAACLGASFDTATLARVSDLDDDALAQHLGEPLARGLIVPLASRARPGRRRDVDLRFLHDRVQQAAYSLVAPDDRPRLHRSIGRLLAESSSDVANDPRLFEIVGHENRGIDEIEDDAERLALVELNRAAARRARASNANDAAMTYLSTAFSLLGEDPFQSHRDVAIAIRQAYGEAACIAGRHKEADRAVDDVLTHARDVLERIPAYSTRITAFGARNEMGAALSTALAALALLGVKLPARPSQRQIVVGLLLTKWRLRGKDRQALLGLPRMKDPRALAALDILARAVNPSFAAAPDLFPLLCFEMVRLTLEYGNAPGSVTGYTGCGVVLSAAMHDVAGAELLDDVCHALADELDAAEHRARVALCHGTFIVHLKHHIRDSLPSLLEGWRLGVDTGDISAAASAIDAHAWTELMSGLPLEQVTRTFELALERVKRLGYTPSVQDMRLGLQFTRNLLDRASDARVIRGDEYDVEAALASDVASDRKQPIATAKYVMAWLAFTHRDLPAAYELSRCTDASVEALMGTTYVAAVHLLHSLVRLQHLAALDPKERKKARRMVDKSLKQLRKLAADAPMNHEHRVELILAEIARVEGRADDAMARYDRAIELAHRHQHVHEEATACGLAARFYLARGRRKLAAAYLADARRALVSWNGWLELRLLEAELGTLIAPAASSAADKPPLASSRHSASSGSLAIDLATVLKASQALTEEILVDSLLKKLVLMLIKNAGAEQGALLAERDGRLVIEAEGKAGGAEVRIDGKSIVDDERLPVAIASYVARTKESVVLHDAAEEGRFTKDPYVASRRPRSVLCAPLVNRGGLIAIVYMENNLTAGAFTAERLEVLRLLSSQAALSLHNARLYHNLRLASERLEETNQKLEESNKTLEEKVTERTQELRDKNEQLLRTQKQLVAQEKLASLGALAAGIAHEIKNPLNFITNFAQLTGTLADDLAASVGQQRERFDDDARADLDETLQLMKDNVHRIDEHGRRASRIIDDMLLHSRSSTGVRAPADLNAMLAESMNLVRHGMRAKIADFDVVVRADYDAAVGKVDLVASDMSRVFVNVISNACYATVQRRRSEGKGYAPEVALRTVSLGDRVEVRIRDNGTGIPADVLHKIYHPFFTTKPPGEGTGLGLSISHDIVVDQHQGKIDVDTAPGDHTEFVITLPRTASA